MALFMHGFRRFTEDIDILVTREALERIHEELEGRGYLPPFTGSKNLRDAELGVRPLDAGLADLGCEVVVVGEGDERVGRLSVAGR